MPDDPDHPPALCSRELLSCALVRKVRDSAFLPGVFAQQYEKEYDVFMGGANSRIAVFIPSLAGGGAERAMLLFARGARQRGAAVDLVLGSTRGVLGGQIPDGVRVIDFGRKRLVQTLPALIRYIRGERPTALFSTISHTNVLSLLAVKLSGTRIPVIVRESNVPTAMPAAGLPARIVAALMPKLYPFATAVISVSDAVASDLLSLNPRLAAKITVLPNPVVFPEMFDLAQRMPAHPWAADEETPFLVAAGRLHPQKDFATLLRAFSVVCRKRKARLLILGEGSERGKLESLSRELDVADAVALPGFVENPFCFFRRAQAFVLSSRYEGMPNVLIQALAFGTPIVATDCPGGHPDVLRRCGCGILVRPGDADDMADAILRALDARRSPEAAAFAEEHFGLNRSVEAYLRLAGIQ